jgi:outer membrane autotransporter protein
MTCLGGDRFKNALQNRAGSRLWRLNCSAATVAAAVAFAGMSTSGALAQDCAGSANIIVRGDGFTTVSALGPLFAGGAGAAAALIAGINTANTAMLTQSTAFVSAPPNPKPNSEGGGAWARGVGGDVNFKNNSTLAFNIGAGSVPANGVSGCNTTTHQDFGGVQFGQDTAVLNYNGWNLHLGQTAGWIETNGDNSGGLAPSISTSTRAPFAGTYAVATNGGFFADALFRFNWYETSLTSAAVNLNDQRLDAHGVSFAASAGYHYDVPNGNWFWEPSVGIVWSSTKVDPLNTTAVGTGTIPPPVVNGTVLFNDIDSFIGRIGLRFGTTAQYGNIVYQPFAAVSIWHEFDGNATANYAAISPNAPATAVISVPNIGTYGQYSLGVTGQLVNTGWLGFARVDYRNGDRIEGWSGTGGIRYQYTPGTGPMDMAFAMVGGAADRLMSYASAKGTKPVFATKAPPKVERPINWTGWYIGGFGGADHGNAHMGFPGLGVAGPQIAGGLLGGTVGYNIQSGAWVYGIEGDAGWTNSRGSVACSGPVAGSAAVPLFNTDCRDQADWLALLTGRIGLAWGRSLYYAKVGGAWTHDSYSVVCNQPVALGAPPCTSPIGAPLASITVGDNRAGWTVGFGTEFALTERWSAKGEFNYIEFGNRNLTAADGTIINAGFHVTEAKIGVNYRLSP